MKDAIMKKKPSSSGASKGIFFKKSQKWSGETRPIRLGLCPCSRTSHEEVSVFTFKLGELI